MIKPSAYVETSIISYVTARPSNDLRVRANQNATVEWWNKKRFNFDLCISDFVISEASLGNTQAVQLRLAALKDIPLLPISENVRTLVRALLHRKALPAQAEVDAFHLALAAVNGVGFLLTWNCRHIANERTLPIIEAVCRQNGFTPPLICTPLVLSGM